MARIELLTSRTELKQKTNADVRNLGPIVQDYEHQVSTSGQANIVLTNFSVLVDSNGVPDPEGHFELVIDGQELTPGQSNDYYFSNIKSGLSTTIVLNSILTSGLNILAKKIGITRESFPNPSSVQATITNDIKPRLHGSIVNKSANYTVLDDDSSLTFLFTDTSTDRTFTLPTAADNLNKVITIKNVSTDKGKVTIDGEGSETIDGYTTIDLDFKNCFIKVQSDGSNWIILNENITSTQKQYNMTVTGTNWTTTEAVGVPYRTLDGQWRIVFNITGTFSDNITNRRITLTNVVFSSSRQSLTVESTAGSSAYPISYHTNPSSGLIVATMSANTTGEFAYTGDLNLASKPTFVE